MNVRSIYSEGNLQKTFQLWKKPSANFILINIMAIFFQISLHTKLFEADYCFN